MDYNVTGDINPKLNAFDLSHNHFTTLSQGWLYPVAWFECVPGDIYTLDYQALVRVQPLNAPILNNLTCDLHAFFVPTRLLWDKWEDFITTVDQSSIPPKTYEGQPPVWCENENDNAWTLPDIELHSKVQDVSDGTKSPALWEYFGFSQRFNPKAIKDYRPVDFLRRAYYFIWNEWFRDENLQQKVDFKYTDYSADGNTSGNLQGCLHRAWRKDYFTAGFISRQKGTAPTISLTGLAGHISYPTQFEEPLDKNWLQLAARVPNFPVQGSSLITASADGAIQNNTRITVSDGYAANMTFMGSLNNNIKNSMTGSEVLNRDKLQEYLSSGRLDLDATNVFDVNDLRDMFAIQKFLERLMMAGSRYIEFLQSQFGVSPSDARLQIPERIGGSSFNINVSEVIQTSSSVSGSPQGNQTGHGMSKTLGGLGSYKAEEFGYIMILANIQPPAVYTDRIPRQMFRKTLLEQYNPHFVNLSFQAVEGREIYADGTEGDDKIFNYSGRYDEMREQTSYVTGQLYARNDEFSLPGYLQYRQFETRPSYNDTFIQANPSKTIFAVQNEDPFICNFYWDVKALRPLPIISEPGLIDHVYGDR